MNLKREQISRVADLPEFFPQSSEFHCEVSDLDNLFSASSFNSDGQTEAIHTFTGHIGIIPEQGVCAPSVSQAIFAASDVS